VTVTLPVHILGLTQACDIPVTVTLPVHILAPKTGLRSSGETAWQYGEVKQSERERLVKP
jgi:hypothetical protein